MFDNCQEGRLVPLEDFINSTKPEGMGLMDYKKQLAAGFGCCWHTLQHHIKKKQGHVFVNEETKIFLLNGRTYTETPIDEPTE